MKEKEEEVARKREGEEDGERSDGEGSFDGWGGERMGGKS